MAMIVSRLGYFELKKALLQYRASNTSYRSFRFREMYFEEKKIVSTRHILFVFFFLLFFCFLFIHKVF